MVKSAMPAVLLELYREGERVPYTGKYTLVNEEGDERDYEPITLDAGDTFPDPREDNLYYMLHTTCCQPAEIPGTESDLPPDDLI